MKKHKKLFIILFVVLFIVVVPLITSIVKKDNKVSVTVTTLSKNVDNITTLNGIVVSEDKKDIYLSQSKGNNYNLKVKVGDFVNKGDTIISYNGDGIDNKISSINEEIKDKKNQIETLKKNLENFSNPEGLNGQINPLENQKAMIDERISALNSSLKASNLTLKELENQKKDLLVKAPIEGTIISINNGGNPTAPLLTIQSKNKIVKGELTEYEIPKISTDMPASLSFEALGNDFYESSIVNIDHNPLSLSDGGKGMAAPNVSNYEITFKVPEDKLNSVYDGFHCLIKIGEESKDLEIPKDAIYESIDDNTKSVWIVQDKKLESKKIKVNNVNDKYILVEGLKEGDNIVTNPSSNFKAGDEVTIK